MDRFLAPVDPSGGVPIPVPPPVPTPTPVPSLDLSGVYARFDWADGNAERRYQARKVETGAEAAALAARIASLEAQLKTHDEKSSMLAETFGNRYVQLALAIIGTIVTQQQVTKDKTP